ncbi:hypothetical protein GRI97_06240 [Altererythrobacter xixiisoli]|uniref:Uncharacterized protein n=1 Tax=Croceibacterium xixiisoli TaxID=1476466 RepID=A0A6I4TQW8_9SPHN|nr:hypothetical protein [Croceibacterium xixiisoli]MXO98585.1 hypothetical protein [Croceibacterium xixiisoli]
MERLTALPAAFDRYSAIGGVLDFAVFDDSDGSEAEVLEAIEQTLRPALPEDAPFDADALRQSGSRVIGGAEFLGEWFDPEAGQLLKRGTWTLAGGIELEDPLLIDLQGHSVENGSMGLPNVGEGGQFALAFTEPPYGLQAEPLEIQDLFDSIRSFILPGYAITEIRDWTSPALAEVSPYFEAGMEWWGVYLFSLYTPQSRRLTIIAGSTTD